MEQAGTGHQQAPAPAAWRWVAHDNWKLWLAFLAACLSDNGFTMTPNFPTFLTLGCTQSHRGHFWLTAENSDETVSCTSTWRTLCVSLLPWHAPCASAAGSLGNTSVSEDTRGCTRRHVLSVSRAESHKGRACHACNQTRRDHGRRRKRTWISDRMFEVMGPLMKACRSSSAMVLGLSSEESTSTSTGAARPSLDLATAPAISSSPRSRSISLRLKLAFKAAVMRR